jgi:hypothetical protein
MLIVAVVARSSTLAETRRFTFLEDRDGTLCRWDESFVSDVWWPDTRVWARYQLNPFEASVTAITPEEAQKLAGEGADLYADVAA